MSNFPEIPAPSSQHVEAVFRRMTIQHKSQLLTPIEVLVEQVVSKLQEHGTGERQQAWIGFDLDGTLAYYDHFRGQDHLGEPIPAAIELIQAFIQAGITCKIFTARVCKKSYEKSQDKTLTPNQIRANVELWCQKHIGTTLEVTNVKDWECIGIIDDRAIQISRNLGTLVAPDHLIEAIVHD